MAYSSSSWVDFFKRGKWREAGHAIQKELNSFMETEDESQDRHARRFTLENNLFVCNQLSIDWDDRNEDSASHDWANGYHAISELYSLMRVQHTCSSLPLELLLSITCNAMWWAVMKVDRLHQHCCSRETLARAIFSLNTAGKSLGICNYEEQMTGLIETDFIQAVKTSASILTNVTPMVCQLLIEIMMLGCLILLDENQKQEVIVSDLKNAVNQLIECLPQLKIHVSGSGSSPKLSNIIRFGWKEGTEFLSINNISSIFEALLFTKAILHLRKSAEDVKEEALKALEILAQIDKNSLTFPFLFHYLFAFANFNLGNLDTCLYYLLKAFSSSSNLFMQGRANILKGQALLLQDKSDLALQSLFCVEYKHKDIQIPLCPYLIGQAYQKLGKPKQQIEILNVLLQCLSAEPRIEPRLHSPLVGIEHRFILCVHCQPELCYEDVLQSAALAHLSFKQPNEAAEKLMELLHVMSVQMDDVEDDASFKKICGLLHDTASALLESQSYHDAQKICESALQFHSKRSGDMSGTDFYNVKEDVIGLLLLAEAKDILGISGVFEILNKCANSIQNIIRKLAQSDDKCAEIITLSKALLARIYLQKAVLNSKRKFEDDATACFQRALHWKEDDPEVILQFALHLLDTNQHEESLALWAMYQDCDQSLKIPDDITLRYLLGQKMGLDLKEEITCRLRSLAQ